MGERIHRLKIECLALYLAMGDRRVPWRAKALAALVAGYAFSPIDLIPDFIPVLGLLDDLLILPLGLYLVKALIPEPVMSDLRRKASLQIGEGLPRLWPAAVVILLIWAGAALVGAFLILS